MVQIRLETYEPRRLLSASPLATVLTDPLPPVEPAVVQVGVVDVATLPGPPTVLRDPGDASGRLFVATRPGEVLVLQDGQVQPAALLDLRSRVLLGGERGLVGLALAPGFSDPDAPGHHTLFTFTSEAVEGSADFTVSTPLPQAAAMDHQSVIAAWQLDPADPTRVDPATRRELLRIDQPQATHNGGEVVFGPDGMLYIALGDGGGANDVGAGHSPGGNAQDVSNVYGSILRIDAFGAGSANGRYGVPADNPFVGTAGIDEIWAYGLRNPYRMGFDAPTGRLIAGDVGQNHVEEVNVIARGGNYGWPLKEGSFRFDQADGSISDDLSGLPAGLIDPALQYDHDDGRAVIGGHVYRGAFVPDLQGMYVFGDMGPGFTSGQLLVGDLDSGELHTLADSTPITGLLYGLYPDARGEPYALSSEGDVQRIVAPLRLTSPAEPQGVERGQVFRVTWVAAPEVQAVQLWAVGPGGWQLLAGEIAAADGGYDWSTAAQAQGWYAFAAYVRFADGHWQRTVSPDWLLVANPANQAPQVALLTPDAGAAVTAGETFTIRWQASDPDGDVVRLSLWAFSDATGWVQPAGAQWLDASAGAFAWDTAAAPTGWYAFAAWAWDGSEATLAQSPDWLHVVVPWSLAFLAPVTGASVPAGEVFAVLWDLENAGGADLSVTLWAHGDAAAGVGGIDPDGDGWFLVADGIDADAGAYAWSTAGLPSGFYRLAAWLGREEDWALVLADALLAVEP